MTNTGLLNQFISQLTDDELINELKKRGYKPSMEVLLRELKAQGWKPKQAKPQIKYIRDNKPDLITVLLSMMLITLIYGVSVALIMWL